MTATNERESQEKKSDVPKSAEAGLGERLAANPEAVKAELAQEATHEVAKFGAENVELTAKVEAAAGPLDAETKAAVAGTEQEAKRAAGELAKDLGVEAKEREPKIVSFEYRDKEGKLLGTAELALSAETITRDLPNGDKQRVLRRLESFKLTGPDGRSAEMSEIIEDFDELKAEILVPDVNDRNAVEPFRIGRVNVETGEENSLVFARSPIDNLRSGMLLHELGHASQAVDEETKPLAAAYDKAMRVRRNREFNWDMAKAVMTTLADKFPEAGIVNAGSIQEMEISLEAEKAAEVTAKAAQEALVTADTTRIAPSELKSLSDASLEAGEALAAARASARTSRDRALNLMRTSMKLMENDAWLRADRWMKKWKEKTGVDLYADVAKDEAKGDQLMEQCAGEAPDAHDAVAEEVKGVNNVRELMRTATATYKVPTKKAA